MWTHGNQSAECARPRRVPPTGEEPGYKEQKGPTGPAQTLFPDGSLPTASPGMEP